MAKKLTNAEYWDKRAVDKAESIENAVDPRVAELDRIYDLAQKQITVEINKIYRTYAKGAGLDVEKLLEKLSIEETHAFWLGMRKKGHLDYITSNYQSRISRLEQIKGDIYAKVREIAPQELDINTQAHVDTINESYYRNIFDVSQQVNQNLTFGGLNNTVLDTMLQTQWLGGNYSTRIWKNNDVLASTIKDKLGAALLTGRSPLNLTDEFAEQFGVSKGAARRLIRTETNYFQNEADARSSEEIGLDRYKYLATLDTRTSQTCRLHDDKLYYYKERVVGVNFPPLHPHCRSTTRPYIGDEYEPQTRTARDANGKNVEVQYMSYEQWQSINGVQKAVPTQNV